MSFIQWFPGHMHKARRQLGEVLRAVDLVVELLDARIPQASANPLIEAMRQRFARPALKVLNKADLADRERTELWKKHLSEYHATAAIAINAHNRTEALAVLQHATELISRTPTVARPLRLVITGIPNVGKSTLINALLRRKAALAADLPAVTRALQRYQLSPVVELWDSPGLLWPKIEDESTGMLLAACHAVGPRALDNVEVAAALIARLSMLGYGDCLAKRYSLDRLDLEPYELLAAIATKRHLRAAQGAPDLERAARMLLTDFRHGDLGKVTLELPQSKLLNPTPDGA